MAYGDAACVPVFKKIVSTSASNYAWFSPLLALLLVSGAPALQQHANRQRVAVVFFAPAGAKPPQLKGLADGLTELGYITGKNITLDMLQSGDYRELRESLQNLSQQRLDAIVTTSGSETALTKEMTRDTPIIFMPAGDPVREGFVHSLANPGTNLTGLAYYAGSDGSGKQLQVFKQVVPSLRHVMVLYDRREATLPALTNFKMIKKVADHMTLGLVDSPVSSIKEAAQALRQAKAANGVFVVCSPIFRAFKMLAAVALQKKLPLFGCNSSQAAQEGALLTYAPDMYHIGYRAASYVDRVLKGAKPQDLPVETPMKYQLVINLKTAEAIRVTVPPEVLQRADKVIR